MCKEIQVVSPENSRDRSGSKVGSSPAGCPQWARYLLTAVLAAIFITPSVGCRFSNEATLVAYRDLVWAKRAYNLRYGNCDRPYGEHFYNGFCAGYSDVCNGGDGYVPALPPVSYRSSRFQSADGVKCVNAWFEGYPAGVAAARKEKVGNYNNVLVSKMMNDAIELEKELKNSSRATTKIAAIAKNKADSESPKKPETPVENQVEDISVGVPPLPENDAFSSVLVPSASPPASKPVVTMPNYAAGNALPPIVQGSGAIRSANRTANQTSEESSTRLR